MKSYNLNKNIHVRIEDDVKKILIYSKVNILMATVWIISLLIVIFMLYQWIKSFIEHGFLGILTMGVLMFIFATAMLCFQLLWMLFGVETIERNSLSIVIEKRILFLSIRKEYSVSLIRNLRVGNRDYSIYERVILRRYPFEYGYQSGLVIFDYGDKTIRVGSNVSVMEGMHLVETIYDDLLGSR